MEPYDLKVKIEDIINNPYKAPEVKYNEILDMLAEAHIEGQKLERERTIKIIDMIIPSGLRGYYDAIIEKLQEPHNDN